MINISIHYGLNLRQSQLEFIDVKLDDDNELFIDPRLIENSTNPVMAPMKASLATYFGHLVHSIATSNIPRARYLLSGIEEPRETRLGYGVDNPNGKSAGPKIKVELINAILNTPVIQNRSINKVSNLRFFIPNLSSDRISDITTKVLKDHLITFTQAQCRKLGIPMQQVHQRDILNPTTLLWEHRDVELPVYFDGTADKPIIFVPKDIVLRQGDGCSDMGYFFRFARNYVMDKDNTLFQQVPRTGKNGALLVKDVNASIVNMKEELSKWIVAHPGIIKEYWEASLDRVVPLSDEEIEQVVYTDRSRRAA